MDFSAKNLNDENIVLKKQCGLEDLIQKKSKVKSQELKAFIKQNKSDL